MDFPPPLPICILAVEDEPIYAQALEVTLAALGYDLLPVVDNAAAAERLFRDYVPDVALLDIRLRGYVNGIALALRLQAIRPVPVVFLTSFTDRATFERARAAGPFAYLNKPFDAAALERALELAVQCFGRPARAEAEAETEPGPGPKPRLAMAAGGCTRRFSCARTTACLRCLSRGFCGPRPTMPTCIYTPGLASTRCA